MNYVISVQLNKSLMIRNKRNRTNNVSFKIFFFCFIHSAPVGPFIYSEMYIHNFKKRKLFENPKSS